MNILVFGGDVIRDSQIFRQKEVLSEAEIALKRQISH